MRNYFYVYNFECKHYIQFQFRYHVCFKAGCVNDMSLVTRKPVFGVCDQARLKPACSATEASLGPKILDLASTGIILSRQRVLKLPM